MQVSVAHLFLGVNAAYPRALVVNRCDCVNMLGWPQRAQTLTVCPDSFLAPRSHRGSRLRPFVRGLGVKTRLAPSPSSRIGMELFVPRRFYPPFLKRRRRLEFEIRCKCESAARPPSTGERARVGSGKEKEGDSRKRRKWAGRMMGQNSEVVVLSNSSIAHMSHVSFSDK